MEMGSSRITVLFEEPFWVALYERTEGRRYEVCKIVFGAEPKDYEVATILLERWHTLRFSPALEARPAPEKRRNPKRMQRQIERELGTAGIGTKAQQALKAMQEQGKEARKTRTRAQKLAEAERMFDLKQEKRREKHKGH